MATRKTSKTRPRLSKTEKAQIARERAQKALRGKRKGKFKTRQIDVVEWLPSGHKKPRRTTWRVFPRERCVSGVSPVCRYCSVGQPLEISQGKGKAKLVDPSVIEGFAVIGPNKKTAMQVRKTGKGYEYFLARFPTENQAWDHAQNLSYSCEEGLALAEGREAYRPPTQTERDWMIEQEANEAQIRQLMMELPSDLLADVGLIRPGTTPEEHAKMVEEGTLLPGYAPSPKKIKRERKPREVYSPVTREWEPWYGEEEADIIHQENLKKALSRVKRKRRQSAKRAGGQPTQGYGGHADVITLGSGPFQWGDPGWG